MDTLTTLQGICWLLVNSLSNEDLYMDTLTTLQGIFCLLVKDLIRSLYGYINNSSRDLLVVKALTNDLYMDSLTNFSRDLLVVGEGFDQ